MQLDPKGKLAARRAYETEMSKRVAWHADGGPDDTPMDCAIRAYFEAAPSPSPAPGVVEALRGAHDAFDTIAECAENCIHSPGQMTNYSAAKYGMALVSTALASLSQPAKGERP